MAQASDLERVAQKVRDYKSGASKVQPTANELTMLARRGNWSNEQNDKPTDNVGLNDVEAYIDDILGAAKGGSNAQASATSDNVPIPADRPTSASQRGDMQGSGQTLPTVDASTQSSGGEGSNLIPILASVFGAGAAGLIAKKLYDNYKKPVQSAAGEAIDAVMAQTDAVPARAGNVVDAEFEDVPRQQIEQQRLLTGPSAQPVDAASQAALAGPQQALPAPTGPAQAAPASATPDVINMPPPAQLANDLQGMNPIQAGEHLLRTGAISPDMLSELVQSGQLPPQLMRLVTGAARRAIP